MKKIKRFFGLLSTFALAFVMAFGVVACDVSTNPNNPTPEIPNPVVITVTSDKESIKSGETATMTATVTGTENKDVTWKVSDPTTVEISSTGVVSVLNEPEILDKNVTITATLVENTKIFGTKTIKVLAPRVDGEVGYLTTDLIDEISGDNITFSGTVTDEYIDKNASINNRTKEYDIEVKMEEDKWSGTWKSAGTEQITDTYRKGTKDNVRYTITDSDGYVQEVLYGHSVEKEMINRNNELTYKTMTDYISIPLAWEAQHYWNHIGTFANGLITDTKISYDPDDPTRYIYEVDTSNENEFFLMAYLAQSLTPILDPSTEWFETVVFVLDEEHEHIVGLEAITYPSYSGATTDLAGNVTGYDTMSVSRVSLEISDIGTTEIEGKQVYDAPEHADKLTAALEKMRSASNYVFQAVENATYEGGWDEADYMSARTLNAAADVTPTFTFDDEIAYRTTSTGTVGLIGYVTEEAAVLARTGMYSSTMDDKPYWTEFTGYRQFDGYYEEWQPFVTTRTEGDQTVVDERGIQGTRYLNGTFVDRVLPKFDFSVNLFECSSVTTQSGVTRYTFKLQESAVTREIAMQSTMHSYASSGYEDPSHPLTIVVDGDGNLISVTFPYEITTAYGTITTTYSHVGTTAINLDRIDTNYKHRPDLSKWESFTMRYYRDENGKELRVDPTDPTSLVYYPDAQTAINSMFGSKASSVPSPMMFIDIFDDYVSGPFCEEHDLDIGSGDTKYVRNFSLTAQTTVYDENMQLTDELWDDFYAHLDDVMITKYGYSKLQNKTDVSGGATGRSDRVIVYAKGDITIRIDNNHTKNFWIYVWLTDDYNLRYTG